MTVAIIDYGSGNLRSAAKAFERAAQESGLDTEIRVTDRAEEVAAADRVVLPGVGAYADCKAGLMVVDGMADALVEAVTGKGRPFLGICVGMQLMSDRGLEHVETRGFGWIGGDVVSIEAVTGGDPDLKIPHMGWNRLRKTGDGHPLLKDVADGSYVYFVHGYHLAARERSEVLAETDHGGPITAVVGRDNMVGTQFHPEKSQEAGLRLIADFLAWKP